MRSRPAPASRANSASSAAKNGLDTPFEMDQKVSPEIGCTKAVTYNHLYRWIMGRPLAMVRTAQWRERRVIAIGRAQPSFPPQGDRRDIAFAWRSADPLLSPREIRSCAAQASG